MASVVSPGRMPLLDRGADVGEHGVQVGTEGRDSTDDDDGDQRSDQAILDGGDATTVVLEGIQGSHKHFEHRIFLAQ